MKLEAWSLKKAEQESTTRRKHASSSSPPLSPPSTPSTSSTLSVQGSLRRDTDWLHPFKGRQSDVCMNAPHLTSSHLAHSLHSQPNRSRASISECIASMGFDRLFSGLPAEWPASAEDACFVAFRFVSICCGVCGAGWWLVAALVLLAFLSTSDFPPNSAQIQHPVTQHLMCAELLFRPGESLRLRTQSAVIAILRLHESVAMT